MKRGGKSYVWLLFFGASLLSVPFFIQSSKIKVIIEELPEHGLEVTTPPPIEVQEEQRSNPVIFTVKNVGYVKSDPTTAVLGGTDAGYFFIEEKDTNCGPALEPGSSCQVSLWALGGREGALEAQLAIGPTRTPVLAVVRPPDVLRIESNDLSNLDIVRGKTPSNWVDVVIINRSKTPSEDLSGQIHLGGTNPEQFELRPSAQSPCRGKLAGGQSCTMQVRSIFKGPGTAQAVLSVFVQNRPILPLRSDAPETAASLEITPRAGERVDPRNPNRIIKRNEAIRLVVRNRGGITSQDLTNRVNISSIDKQGVDLTTTCRAPLAPDETCEIRILLNPLKPGPFSQTVNITSANLDGPFGDRRTHGASFVIAGMSEDLGIAIDNGSDNIPQKIMSSGQTYIFRVTGTDQASLNNVIDPKIQNQVGAPTRLAPGSRPDPRAMMELQMKQPFEITHNCPRSLKAGESCAVEVKVNRAGKAELLISSNIPVLPIEAPL